MKTGFRSLAKSFGVLALAITGCSSGVVNAPVATVSPRTGATQVVLVSMDGFRRSYLDTDSLPTLHGLGKDGVVAEAMTPSFPTLTFPNHYTIVTGLYPEHHGITGNTIFDPSNGALFTMSNAASKESRWWLGEPIWVTAEKQGEKAASMFWVGSEVEIGGVRPTRWKPFDARMTFRARVDSVLSWLELKGDQRLSLITLYFDEPDHTGHDAGPDSPRTAEAAARTDSALGRLVQGMKDRGLYDSVDLIVVSDHGMSQLSPDRVVHLDEVVDTSAVRIVSLSPDLLLVPRDGDARGLLSKVRKLAHVTSWLREDVPARLHYNEGQRITPVVAVADDGWTIALHGRRVGGGAHGFDNVNASMNAIFVAHGPDFRRSVTIPKFPNVDVYDLLAHLLHLRAAPNDGTLAPFASVLR